MRPKIIDSPLLKWTDTGETAYGRVRWLSNRIAENMGGWVNAWAYLTIVNVPNSQLIGLIVFSNGSKMGGHPISQHILNGITEEDLNTLRQQALRVVEEEERQIEEYNRKEEERPW